MKLVDAIDQFLPKNRPISHHEPLVTFPPGAVIRDLELRLSKYCGVDQCVAVASGSAALHLALLAIGIKPGEEVLVPSLTFVATANAVRYVGAIPHFIDGALSINVRKLRKFLVDKTKSTGDRRGRLNLETNRVISALIVVDLLGFPAELEKLEDLAHEFNLKLVEDAAQALGSSLGARKCGSFGDAAIFSFNNNKIITGGGGGALLTNDAWVAAKAWSLATTARLPHQWKVAHAEHAFNYRMTSLSASLILDQLNKIDAILAYKRRLFDNYKGALFACKEIEFLEATEEWQGSPNYWLTSVKLNPVYADKFDKIMDELANRGIGARAIFTPLHLLPMFNGCPHDSNMLYCEDSAKRIICLPSGKGLA